MTDYLKAENICIVLSLFEMTYSGEKNSNPDEMELHSYVLIANAIIHYR